MLLISQGDYQAVIELMYPLIVCSESCRSFSFDCWSLANGDLSHDPILIVTLLLELRKAGSLSWLNISAL